VSSGDKGKGEVSVIKVINELTKSIYILICPELEEVRSHCNPFGGEPLRFNLELDSTRQKHHQESQNRTNSPLKIPVAQGRAI
jgi:hypothetical protein